MIKSMPRLAKIMHCANAEYDTGTGYLSVQFTDKNRSGMTMRAVGQLRAAAHSLMRARRQHEIQSKFARNPEQAFYSSSVAWKMRLNIGLRKYEIIARNSDAIERECAFAETLSRIAV